jgi:hypothetical protein
MIYDRIIDKYNRIELDHDLYYCPENNVVFQKDLSLSVEYGQAYFEKYMNFRGSKIANQINEARIDLVSKFNCSCLLDVGIGSGEFITKTPIKTYGYDVNKFGQEWLKKRKIFIDPYINIPPEVNGITCWDVIEHMQYPTNFLDLISPNCYLFIAIPIINNLHFVRKSRHFRPNEHYYYFTKQGLISYLCDVGFNFLTHNELEIQAGREQIESFVFIKKDYIIQSPINNVSSVV